ncbi:hypothetical protein CHINAEXTREME_19330 [Halobiforma lacisalsi AJ5]|uniref:Glycerophosphoryl diester phosphodiesterase membrane domain-containing protein n=1 Tax=Natronobacterium lacisalsi AJ5 TaxID=358396 RepID=A0A1P8LVF1_NATLA|nr:hypothetical protein [Halobiforma lacisalsi]APW99790.1 hypothetical protein CHINAEXTREME_19330 [Halobiforma lacisalsi AJ5]
MDAIDDLGDAIDVTRDLLLPVRVGLWLKLAVVAFFVGGNTGLGGGSGAPTGDFEPTVQEPGVDAPVGELPDDVLAIAAILVVAAIVLWLVFSLISAIMEFVFLESLRSGEVRIRRFAGANLGRGLRLFGFRLVAGLVLLVVIGVPLAYVLLGAPSPEAVIGELLGIVLLGIVLGLVYTIVMRFTSEFVAPVMLLEERGVLSAWSRFWGALTSNLGEYAVYLVLVWILGIVVNIAAGFLILFAAIVVLIPFGIVGFLLVSLGDVGVWLAAPVVVLAVLAVLLVVAIVQMPVRTYFQYYALLLLGDTDADLDLIPERRAAAREGERGGTGGAGAVSSSDSGPDDGSDPGTPDGRWGRDSRDEGSVEETPLWDREDGDGDESDRDNDDRGW